MSGEYRIEMAFNKQIVYIDKLVDEEIERLGFSLDVLEREQGISVECVSGYVQGIVDQSYQGPYLNETNRRPEMIEVHGFPIVNHACG